MPSFRVSVLGVQWAAIALFSALIHAPLAAQSLAWTQQSTTGPSARAFHAMAYDSQRNRTVMSGGQNSTYLSDTWEWDGITWTQVTPPGPSARRGHAMAFDSQRGRTVLFGGLNGNSALGDTWEWDGATWTQVSSVGPVPRQFPAMAYDSQRGRTVLFGGHQFSNALLGDTWEWNGVTWSQVSTSGPAPRWIHQMAYDSQRGRTVLFGGNNSYPTYPGNGTSFGDTWEWDGTTWTQASTTRPTARELHAMAYDSQRGQALLFGGTTNNYGLFFGDTWGWNGVSWTLMTNMGPVPRAGATMAYDNQRMSTVLFGGYDNSSQSFYGDTWEYSTAGHFSNYGAGCAGSVFIPSVCAQLNPNGGTLVGTTAPLEFGIRRTIGPTQIQSFDVFTQSTGGMQTVPAHIYPFSGTTPLASTTITVGPTPGFYTATFSPPVAVSGGVLLAIDVSAQTVVVPNLTSGSISAVYSRTPPAGSWTLSLATNRPAFRVVCRDYLTPTLGNTGDPILGTTYNVTLSNALPSTGAVSLTGLSDVLFQSFTLPYHLPNAPGCDVLASPDATLFVITSPTGTATDSITVPNSTSYIGVELFHQWAVFDPVNPLGIIVSDAGRAWLGT